MGNEPIQRVKQPRIRFNFTLIIINTMNNKYFQEPSKRVPLNLSKKRSIDTKNLRIRYFGQPKSKSEKSSPVASKDFCIKLHSGSKLSKLNSPSPERIENLKPNPNFSTRLRLNRNSADFLKSKIVSPVEKIRKGRSTSRDNSKKRAKRPKSLKKKLVLFVQRHFTQTSGEFKTLVSFYKFLKPLGQGAFGKVVLAEQVLTSIKVAIKIIDKSFITSESERKKVFREIFILKKIQSNYVINIFEYFENDENFFIVLNHMPGGDLLQYLKENGALSEDFAKYLFKQILLGVQSIHQHKILHRDIKLDNVLLDSTQSNIKICDFGVSKILKTKNQMMDEKCGTPAYLAPEIILGCGYEGYWSDIWSLGVLLYCLTCASVPFRGQNIPDLHKSILSGTYTLPSHLSDPVKDLISKMLKKVPTDRISIENSLGHKWFENCLEVQQAHQTPTKLKTRILSSIQELGFPMSYITNSLETKSLNHIHAIYHCLQSSSIFR